MTLSATRAPQVVTIATRPASWFGWSIFLGCSWTWCIGMFLPILLVRDYGLLGWVAFAVPNVIGAAAMGFLIRDAEMSARILQLHHHAVAAFSAVTASFNLYFAFWFAKWLDLEPQLFLTGVVLFALIAIATRRSSLRAASFITLVSLIVLAIVLRTAIVMDIWPPLGGQRSLSDLLYIAPVCVLGFGACPYLDATFHRPIAALSKVSRHRAFVFGFGLVFLTMILLTLLYSSAALTSLYVVAASVGIHAIVQALWKVWIHRDIARRADRRWDFLILALILAAVLVNATGPNRGVTIYLCFLAFFALVFPAYVLIVMLPPRGRQLALPNRRTVSAWIATVLLCLPCLWEGFILEHRLWLLPIVFVVLAARQLAIRPMILPGTAPNA
jgi:hypothetical protein